MGRVGEGGIGGRGVAVLHLRGDVAGRGGPDQRRALGRRLGQFGDDGQVFVVDDDGFQRVFRLFGGFGDQRDHRLADEADDVVGERRAQRRGPRRTVGALEHRRQRQRLHPGGDQIGAGQDRDDARHRAAAVASMETMRACACGERRKDR